MRFVVCPVKLFFVTNVTLLLLLLLLTLNFFLTGISAKYQTPEHCFWTPASNDSLSSSTSSSSSSNNNNNNNGIVTKVSVTCTLRTLTTDSSTVNALQAEGTVRLNLECNEILFTESFLPPRTFKSLQQLDELSVSNCKILEIPVDTFDGLRDLKRLTVRTKNREWTPSKYLRLVAGSLDGLKELQQLDLSDSNIETIPEDVFCSLSNLQTLNLSRNSLHTMDPLGFLIGGARRPSVAAANTAVTATTTASASSSNGNNNKVECNGGFDIKTLDMSYNRIRTVQPYGSLSKLRRLQHLYLQHNEITEISVDSLSPLTGLRILNLSANSLESLPDNLFANAKEIREIHLQNNALYELPRKLFSRLEQLVVLNLSNNKISQIDDEPFVGLIRLVVLDLSRNALTHIKSKFFKDLLFLQILDLRNNSIGFVEDNAFLPLYNLHTLNLAENRLHQISAHLFNGLYVLSKLTLSNNLIVSINALAFKNCSALKELDLSSNAISDVPTALTELSFLRTLDLGENQIHSLKNGSFRNMELLTGLRLVDNNIGNLTEGMFWDLPNLQVLNLSKNKIQQISQGTFARNTQIQAIRLDANFLTDVNGVFVSLLNLLWLNLSNNHLVWFDYAMVPRSLKWLDVHGNYIERLANYYNLQEELNVRTLDASHNRITDLTDMSIPNTAELVFVNNNFIRTVKVNTFLEKSNLVRVDMYANEITKLDINAIRLNPVPKNRSLPEFYIGGNPFDCDCTMDWLPMINNMTRLRQHPKIMDLENVVCKVSYSRGSQHVAVTSAGSSPQLFLCRYETHCFTVCKCCDFDACDCEMTCPSNCTCYHDQTWSTNVVDCSGQASQRVPNKIPMDATHVYLDGNNLVQLQDHVFIGRKNMVSLYLNASRMDSLQNHSFNGLNALQTLHLEDNSISRLDGHEFDQLLQLKELYLQNNRISYVGNLTFLPHRYLQILRLDGNRIVTYPVWQLTLNSYLVEVTLGNNRWSCKCQFLQEFQAWAADNRQKVTDHTEIACYPPEIEDDDDKRRYLDLNSTSCTDYLSGAGWALGGILNEDYFAVFVALCVIVLLLLIAVIFVFVFRNPMGVWLYTRYGIRLFRFKAAAGGAGVGKHYEEDREKLYDGYVVYSPKDEEFVLQSIVAELEHGSPAYHLCLHYRDLPHHHHHHHSVGNSSPFHQQHSHQHHHHNHTSTIVIEAAAASRRIILVLTRNFLQTEWSRYEFRAAVHEALKGRTFKLVLVEDSAILPEAELDSELRPYLKVNSKVRWGEKRFWERLRYLMPKDVRKKTCNYKRNVVNNYTLESMTTGGSSRCHNGGLHHQQHSQHHHHRNYLRPPSPPPPTVHHIVSANSGGPSSGHHHGGTVFKTNLLNNNATDVPPSYNAAASSASRSSSVASSTKAQNTTSSGSATSQEEANYSSATTASPSPRPHHRQLGIAAAANHTDQHIYTSIDTPPEYLAAATSNVTTFERAGSRRNNANNNHQADHPQSSQHANSNNNNNSHQPTATTTSATNWRSSGATIVDSGGVQAYLV